MTNTNSWLGAVQASPLTQMQVNTKICPGPELPGLAASVSTASQGKLHAQVFYTACPAAESHNAHQVPSS